jgi:hypothetical protein
MRTEVVRAEVSRLMRQVPFRPLILSLENGDRITIGHPENIALDPGDNGGTGSPDFDVITGPLRVYGTFEAVSSVALVEAHGDNGA